MDYSKKTTAGTRVLDPIEARTLATGIGSTVLAARSTGSARMDRVAAGIRPGQIVSDEALSDIKGRREAVEAGAMCLDATPEDITKAKFPYESTVKQHKGKPVGERPHSGASGASARVVGEKHRGSNPIYKLGKLKQM